MYTARERNTYLNIQIAAACPSGSTTCTVVTGTNTNGAIEPAGTTNALDISFVFNGLNNEIAAGQLVSGNGIAPYTQVAGVALDSLLNTTTVTLSTPTQGSISGIVNFIQWPTKNPNLITGLTPLLTGSKGWNPVIGGDLVNVNSANKPIPAVLYPAATNNAINGDTNSYLTLPYYDNRIQTGSTITFYVAGVASYNAIVLSNNGVLQSSNTASAQLTNQSISGNTITISGTPTYTPVVGQLVSIVNTPGLSLPAGTYVTSVTGATVTLSNSFVGTPTTANLIFDSTGSILRVTSITAISPAVIPTTPVLGQVSFATNNYWSGGEIILAGAGNDSIHVTNGDNVIDLTHSLNTCILAYKPDKTIYNTGANVSCGGAMGFSSINLLGSAMDQGLLNPKDLKIVREIITPATSTAESVIFPYSQNQYIINKIQLTNLPSVTTQVWEVTNIVDGSVNRIIFDGTGVILYFNGVTTSTSFTLGTTSYTPPANYPYLLTTPPTAVTVVQGVPYSLQLSAAPNNSIFTDPTSSLPAGLSVTNTGLISGTPTGSGIYSANISLSSGTTATVVSNTTVGSFTTLTISGITPRSALIGDSVTGTNVPSNTTVTDFVVDPVLNQETITLSTLATAVTPATALTFNSPIVPIRITFTVNAPNVPTAIINIPSSSFVNVPLNLNATVSNFTSTPTVTFTPQAAVTTAVSAVIQSSPSVGYATYTVASSAGLTVGENIVITGSTLSVNGNNGFNGTFQIVSISGNSVTVINTFTTNATITWAGSATAAYTPTALPTGVTNLNNTAIGLNGLVSLGTPTVSGTISGTLTFSNGTQSAAVPLTIVINPVPLLPAPIFTLSSNPGTPTADGFTSTLSTTSCATPITFNLTSSAGVINAGSNTYQWVCSNGNPLSKLITITGLGASTSATVQITASYVGSNTATATLVGTSAPLTYAPMSIGSVTPQTNGFIFTVVNVPSPATASFVNSVAGVTTTLTAPGTYSVSPLPAGTSNLATINYSNANTVIGSITVFGTSSPPAPTPRITPILSGLTSLYNGFSFTVSNAADFAAIPATATTSVVSIAKSTTISLIGNTYTVQGLNPGQNASVTVTYKDASKNTIGTSTILGVANSPTSSAPPQILVVPIPTPALTPKILWKSPTDITTDVGLSSQQLNAQAFDPKTNLPINGTFTYFPTFNEKLPAGKNNLLLNFTPQDTNLYNQTSAQVLINVADAVSSVKFNLNLSHLTYDGAVHPISVSSTPSNISYSITYNGQSNPPINAGTYKVEVKSNNSKYTGAESGDLVIDKATPRLVWNPPISWDATIPIDSSFFNASSSLPGTMSYSIAKDDKLNAGNHDVTVTFTPLDSVNYISISTTRKIEFYDNSMKTLKVSQPKVPTYVEGTRLPSKSWSGEQISAFKELLNKSEGKSVEIYSYVANSKNNFADLKSSADYAIQLILNLENLGIKANYSIHPMGSTFNAECSKFKNKCIKLVVK